MKRPDAGSDGGSALILVLLVVLFAGVVTGAVLQFAGAGLKIAPQSRDLRNQSNYLQGAVDGAISNIRNSTAVGTVTGPQCPPYTPQVPSGIPGASTQVFSVSCTPLSTSVLGGGGPDQPSFAILTLGSNPDGLKQGNSNNNLLIDGGVFSHGVITGPTAPQAGMQVNGSISAVGACTGKVSSSDTLFSVANNCGHAPGGTFGDDPQYTSGVASPAALTSLIGPDSAATLAAGADPVPTCAGGDLTFAPGYYSVTPTQLKAKYASNCNGTFLFPQGVYYFDYSGTWTIPDTIAGTRAGTTCDQAAAGTQFVFGGLSQSVIGQHARLEICPPRSGQGITGLPQRIAVYGLSAGNPNNPVSTPTAQPLTMTATVAPTSVGTTAFALPADARVIGEQPLALASTAVMPEKEQAQLHYSSFGLVPKGSRISSVSARLVHSFGSQLSGTLTATRGSTTQDFPVPDDCTAGCTVDLTSFLSGGVAWRDLDQLVLDLNATTANNKTGTASVDGVELRVSYVPPALEAQTCPNGCDFFTSGVQADVLLHGTVYTPAASWNVDLHNKNATAFDRGIVVRNLQTSASASYKQLDAPFSLPKGTPSGRLVLFRGSVGPDAAHLVELLRACVLYTDDLTSPAVSGPRAGYQVSVRRWSLLQAAASESPDCH